MRLFYLFINTINEKRPSFAAFDGDGHILCSYKFIDKQENLVQELGRFFKKEKMRSDEIRAVLVISGPGSFSASRAGIVLGNSFNFLNRISVLSVKDTEASTEELIKNNLNALKKSKKTSEAEVYYQKEPNITI